MDADVVRVRRRRKGPARPEVQATSQVAALNLALSDGAPAATARTLPLQMKRCNSRPATSETGHVARGSWDGRCRRQGKGAEIETIDREALRTRYSS